MRLFPLVVSFAMMGAAGLSAAPQGGKEPKLDAAAKRILEDSHKTFLAIWVEWMKKQPLKYDPIKEEDRGKYVGGWKGSWENVDLGNAVTIEYRLEEDGTYVSTMELGGEKESEKGNWYLHKGALQFWDGPVSKETEGQMLMVVQKGALKLIHAQARSGRITMKKVKKVEKVEK